MPEPRSVTDPLFRTFWGGVPGTGTPSDRRRARVIAALTHRSLRRDVELAMPNLPRVRGAGWERDFGRFLDAALAEGMDLGWRLPLELCGYLRLEDPAVWAEAASCATLRWFTMGDPYQRWMMLSCRDAGAELCMGLRRGGLADDNDIYTAPYEHVWPARFAMATGTSATPEVPHSPDGWRTFGYGLTARLPLSLNTARPEGGAPR
ncbi:hypothetical protein ABGB14_09415 [Nonomuraea sp. B10E15]|uniref:hypothetical protein n=1 Tax=Nonomuraea sp. B10E15 TaxID=3153560 RepID=UPI00325F58B7